VGGGTVTLCFNDLTAPPKVRIKCTLVHALRLCTGRTAYRGSRGIALPFYGRDTRRGWLVSITPGPLSTPGKNLLPIVQEAGWAPGPVWTGAMNLASIGIRSPDRPARSQSLYRLRYPPPTPLRIYTYKQLQFCCGKFLFLGRTRST
jgi:hypothetical protein